MRRLLLLLLLAVTITLPALGGQSGKVEPSPQLDLGSYLSELSRWSESAGRLGNHPEEAASLRKQLPEKWSVSVQEQQFQVSTRWLGDALDKLAKNPKSAPGVSREMSHRLQSMLDDAQALAHNSPSDPGSARAKLDNILNRREFRSVRTSNEMESLWDEFTDWVWAILNKILNHAAGHPKVTRVLLWAVVALLSLAFLAWLIYSLSRVSLAGLTLRPSRAQSGKIGSAETWREMVQRAREAAANGDFREAIRIIYTAAVLSLGESGAWRIDPARTHREYLHLLPQDSSQRPPLSAITHCFERIWYGHAAATAADYDAVMSQLESLQ